MEKRNGIQSAFHSFIVFVLFFFLSSQTEIPTRYIHVRSTSRLTDGDGGEEKEEEEEESLQFISACCQRYAKLLFEKIKAQQMSRLGPKAAHQVFQRKTWTTTRLHYTC